MCVLSNNKWGFEMENCVSLPVANEAPTPQPRLGRPPSWTDERVAILRALIAKGETARNIGQELGITRNAAIGKALRLGLHIGGGKKDRTRGHRKDVADKRNKLTRLFLPRQYQERIAPSPTVAAPDSINKTLLELRGSDCRYPVTEDSPFLFCGHPQDGGSSYCAHHHQLCTMDKRRAA